MTDPHRRLRKLTLLFVGSLTVMSGTAIAPSLPGLQAAFAHAPNAALLTRLVLTAPAIAIALLAPFAGFAIDRFGRRRLLFSCVVIYGLVGATGAILQDIEGLLLSRVVLGVAVAGIMTSATVLAGDYYDGAERQRFLGLQSGFTGLCGLLFLAAGGLLADVHWRAPFFIYTVALALIPCVWLYLPDAVRSSASERTLHAGEPIQAGWLIPLGSLYGIALIGNAAFTMIPTQVPFLLRELGIGQPSRAGFAIGLAPLFIALTSFQYARLRERFHPVAIFALGFGLMGFGFVLLSAAAGYTTTLCAMALVGIGMGALQPNLVVLTLTLTPASLRGRIVGGLTSSLFVGQFLSPLASQPLIDGVGISAAFGYVGLLLVAAAASAWFVSRARRESGTQLDTIPK